MFDKVRAYINEQGMIQKGDRIIVGVSGGADSVCLLLLLVKLRVQYKTKILVVHVHHMLRGAAADQDENFVRELCEKQNITAEYFHVPVTETAKKNKISLEEAGRLERYRIFREVSIRWKADKLALAHHANDVAETMLYNLARGSSIAGLCSLRPVRAEVIRPLLCVTKEEILHYLKFSQVSWCTDLTNEDVTYRRNRIRQEIIPSLEKNINSGTVRHMAAAAEDLLEAEDYLADVTKECMELHVEESLPGQFLISSAILGERPLMQRRIIGSTLAICSQTAKDIGRIHIRSVLQLFGKTEGKQIDLPYNITAVKIREGVRLYKKGTEYDPMESKGKEAVMEYQVTPGSTMVLPDLSVTADLLQKTGELILQKRYTKWIDYDKINNVLVLRKRRSGDFIVINDNGGQKKLKKYFIDSKIPVEKRDVLWLLADGQEIVWIVGERLSQRYYVTDSTKNILRLTLEGENIDE